MLYKDTAEQEEVNFLKNQKKCLVYLKKLAETIKAHNIDHCYQESVDDISKSECTLNLHKFEIPAPNDDLMDF